MKSTRSLKLLSSFVISLVLVFSTAVTPRAAALSPELLSALQSHGPDDEISVLITLPYRIDLFSFTERDRRIRRPRIITALQNMAALTQGPVRAFLERARARRIRPFWIFNGMAVTARPEVIRALGRLPGVESIRLDATIRAPEPPAGVSPLAVEPEWNLIGIGAPELWDLGYTGAGTVVASMDTGVDPDHPDLMGKWRGGTNSWFDPYDEHPITPYDSIGHGTGTMGIMVGGSAGGTAIGVAPGAQWIAVKIFNDAGFAWASDIHQGFQWLMDPDGNPATDDLPDVVNNSWGFEDAADLCLLEFHDDIQALRAAGISVVFAAGNDGPGSSTSSSPANYFESFSVGAINDLLTIAPFSSRGPSACDVSPFPDVAAPGVGIRTSDLTFGGIFPDSYQNVSGTSFAAPHVAGATALLISAFPDRPVFELETALKESALDLGMSGIDNDYGYGLIDIVMAYNVLLPEDPLERPTAAVHRFWSPVFFSHFYTMSEEEKNIVMTNPDWIYEGAAWYAFSARQPGTLPVHRFWSPVFFSHFYTISEGEKDIVMTNPDWIYEGAAYYAYPTDSVQDALPVHRFWSPVFFSHFYTISEEEKNIVMTNSDWIYEGAAWYAHSTP